MRISDKKREETLIRALEEIPMWVKEKELRYKKEQQLAKKVFGNVVRQIERGRK
jgi:hypothetical protein